MEILVVVNMPTAVLDTQRALYIGYFTQSRNFKHRKYQKLGMSNKVRGDKMRFVCIFFHIC